MSNKCCKSYKEDKACKKCPRFRDWNYLMSWTPAQLDPQNGRRGEGLNLSSPCDTGIAANTRTCLTAKPFE